MSQGHPDTLVASHPGNQSALKSGVYSRSGKPLEPRAQAVAEAIMGMPHTDDVDELGAVAIGPHRGLARRHRRGPARPGVDPQEREPRGMVDKHLAATWRLTDLLDRYGMTPKGRAKWARQLAEGESLAQTIHGREGGRC